MATGDKTIIASKDYVNQLDNARKQEIGSVTKVKPTIDLDFAKNEYEIYDSVDNSFQKKPIADILTVINGIGSVETPRGRIESTSASNTPRLTFKDGEPQGLLVEESRTNYLDVSHRAHKNDLVGFPVLSISSPSQNNSLSSVKFDATGLTGHVRSYVTVTNPQNYHTGQALVKGIAGETLKIEVRSGDSSVVAQIAFIFNGEWQLVDTSAASPDFSAFTGTDYYVGLRKDTINTATVFEVAYIGIEEGSFPTSLIPESATFTSRASTATYYDSTGTLQTAVVDEARYTYNPADLSAPPVLMDEEARTNLCLSSNDFRTSAEGNPVLEWVEVAGDTTIAQNATTSIDGSVNADALVISDSVNGSYGRYISFAGSINTQYTASCYVKKGDLRYVAIQFENSAFNSSRYACILDLDTGQFVSDQISTPDNFGAQYIGNGWYRIWVTATSDADGGAYVASIRHSGSLSNITSFTGVVGQKTYIDRFQVEEGGYPTSIIETAGTEVTRASDVVSYAQSTRVADNVVRTLGSEFNRKKGTVYCEFYRYEDKLDTNAVAFVLHDGSFDNSLYLNIAGSFVIRQNNTVVKSIYGQSALLNEGLNRVVFVYDVDSDSAFVVVNGTVLTLTSNGVLGELEAHELQVGAGNRSVGALGYSHNGVTICRYYPKALTEAECITLTS